MYSRPVVLITGATRGIGLAIAECFAAAGYALALTWRSDEPGALAVADKLREKEVDVLLIHADLQQSEAPAQVVEQTIAHYQRVDVLINNAGFAYDGAFAMMSPEKYQSVLQTNLLAPLRLSLFCIPHLLHTIAHQRDASIVMMSSISGLAGKEGQAPYATSKGGMIGLTRLLARRFGSQGLRVNALAPGFIRTAMVEKLQSKMYQPALAASATPRMGNVEEVAAATFFLATSGSSYCNGTVLRLDGGFLK